MKRGIFAFFKWIIIIYEKKLLKCDESLRHFKYVFVCAWGCRLTFWNYKLWFLVWAFHALYRSSSLEKIFILSRELCVKRVNRQTDVSWRMKLLHGLMLAVAVLVLAAGHSVESGCQDWATSDDPKIVCCLKCKPGEFCKGRFSSRIKWLIYNLCIVCNNVSQTQHDCVWQKRGK